MLRTVRRGALLLAVGLVTAAVVAWAQGHVLLHRCVEAGAWADAGLRLAVLRDASECPDGAFGVGGVPQGAVLLLSIALPVLALHVALTALGIGLGALVVRSTDAVAGLARRWLRVPPATALPVPARTPTFVEAAPVARPGLGLLVARPRRAPPLPA